MLYLMLLVILACFDRKQRADKHIYFKHSFSDQMESDTSSSSSSNEDDDELLVTVPWMAALEHLMDFF